MKTIHEIKDEQSKKLDTLITKCLVFFAFSEKQFHEHKTPLQEGEKYISIGAGGYMPKSQLENWRAGIAENEKWYKEQTKSLKARRELIAYELANHEAYYTGSIEDTLSALGEGYTSKEVWTVYQKESKKQEQF